MQQAQQPTPQQALVQAKASYMMGDYHEASKHSGLLRSHFNDLPPVLAINGIIFSRLGLDAPAITDLERAAELTQEALAAEDDQNPNRPRIIDQLVLVCVAWCNSLVRMGEIDQALDVIERALAYDPDRPDAIAAKAEALAAKGDQAGAQKLIDAAFPESMDPIRLAIASGRIALGADSKPSDELINLVRDQTDQVGLHGCDLGDALRVLGDLQDRTGSYDDAFSAYRRAANLRKGTFPADAHATMTSKLIAEWTPEEMGKLNTSSDQPAGSVLLLGAPCSGVNELAALLGQADTISSVGPLETLGTIAQRTFAAKHGVMRPALLSPKGLRGKQLQMGATTYAAQVAGFAKPDSTHTIDTNPLNLWLAGLAAIMIPNLTILLCRRDPLACTLDCYTADLPGMFPYAAKLENAASYIADCNRMMDHWKTALTDERVGCNLIEIDYAALEKDPMSTARALATTLGAQGLDSIAHTHLPIRKSPDPKNYQRKLTIVDDFFAQLSADA